MGGAVQYSMSRVDVARDRRHLATSSRQFPAMGIRADSMDAGRRATSQLDQPQSVQDVSSVARRPIVCAFLQTTARDF
jgi:hypothetical protein